MWLIAWINNIYERSPHLNNNQIMHFHCTKAKRRHVAAKALSARITFVKCIIRLNIKLDLHFQLNAVHEELCKNCENICEMREQTMPTMTQFSYCVSSQNKPLYKLRSNVFCCWRNFSRESQMTKLFSSSQQHLFSKG